MTANELQNHFSNTFGLKAWPPTFEVDAETYGYVVQAVIDNKIKEVNEYFDWQKDHNFLDISLGENGGIMFKGVELILLRK